MVVRICFLIMWTWKQGRTIVWRRMTKHTMSLEAFVNMVGDRSPKRVSGTAVFMSGSAEATPLMLLHHLQCNQVLHDQVILLTATIEDVPRVWLNNRFEVNDLGQGIAQVKLHFGFMQDPDVAETLRTAKESGSGLDLGKFEDLIYCVGGQVLIPSKERPGMALW